MNVLWGFCLHLRGVGLLLPWLTACASVVHSVGGHFYCREGAWIVRREAFLGCGAGLSSPCFCSRVRCVQSGGSLIGLHEWEPLFFGLRVWMNAERLKLWPCNKVNHPELVL